ncbi:PREDICTED: serine/threonine-protein phosphatase 6 regulatory subunit 2 [Gekko japonicus]|uniref:Serine/threonine-protein phosphatase 6 regulatory subunit 2 n=1 Tax=Gekko japonicus TaxID=146911 RepID=A0ABM1KBB2_GEKJA|nr:PREDICTED: serine/threonine-protein phosphatase 6 regulatory subunit 2 [Gekko japonicus]
MFWKFDLNTTSHVDKLLDKPDVTLRELMDEDDLLQECKAQNRRLVDFLCQQSCMEELVSLITHEPPLDMDEKVRFKYPNTACELLTSDVPQINDKLGGDEMLLNILYDFLDQEPPLNPLLASFFSKTTGSLIARKTEQVISFLRKKVTFLDLVLKHIDASAMMDLLLRLVSCVEPAQLRQEVLSWLNKSKVIQRLVELISPNQDEDRQSNASQTLCDIIRLSRDQSSPLPEAAEPDPLLAVLESQECVEQLLKNMFDGEQTESCLVNGTQVLLTLLEPRRAGMEGLMDAASQGAAERPSSYAVSSSILCGIESRLKDFHHLLLSPPKRSSILTTIGVLEEPLGNARLHGARLIAALLHTNTAAINQELCRLSTMDLLLDLFFKYTWNNFLHFQVELCIAVILAHSANESNAATKETENKEGLDECAASENVETSDSHPENIMVTHLFQTCCLVQRILDAWEANDKIQAEGGMRRGNMGHLTRIANIVVQNMEKGPMQAQICEFVRGLPEDCRGRWESFVEETLTEANRRNTVDLVSTHHLHSSSEDEDLEAAFPSDLSLQQAFSEYQIQQMTANFVDQFGFNDEEFADQDDNINAPFDRIAEISFSIEADDDSPNASLFEACCSERIQRFDDNEEEEEEEDIWEEKEISYATQVKSRTRFGVSHPSEESSKSDLQNGDHDDHGDSGGEEADQASSSTAVSADENGSPSEQKSSPEGSEWTVAFEPVSGKPAASCVAMDVGSSVWDSAASDSKEERGWAKFADFQPFCCSEAGPRCSSPVDTESSGLEGSPQQSQDKNLSAASPCVWNVCLARKAPLVASGSSSSSGSDSEEEEKEADVATETFSAGSGQEAIPLTVDAETEKAPVSTSAADSVAVDKVTVLETGSRTPPPCTDPQHASATTAPTEARRDRKEELPPESEAALNGPA